MPNEKTTRNNVSNTTTKKAEPAVTARTSQSKERVPAAAATSPRQPSSGSGRPSNGTASRAPSAQRPHGPSRGGPPRRGSRGGKPSKKEQKAKLDQAAAPATVKPPETAGVPTEPPAAGTTGPVAAQATTTSKVITLPATITVRDLSILLNSSPINIIRELMKNGVMANINQEIDFDTAAIIAGDLGFEAEKEKLPEPVVEEVQPPARKRREYTPEETAKLKVRPPVVTIMGHVDHGKTSLLDNIRQTNVVASEVGGITQHIGAYQVEKQGKKITFLDTPGHEAFTAMRARGAMVTDIAVLVVAADDGVQPQTIEAINHARAAQVPIIVALNKIDRPNANPDAVKRQLSDVGLLIEDYGGDVICVPVSAKQRINLDTLLEMILLVAEMADLKANPEAPASGAVIEGRRDKAKGPLATLLVQEGTLHPNDYLVIGNIAGKVRAMFDDKGQRLDSAPPAMPVVVLGLNDVPNAGEPFRVVGAEHEARALAAAEATRRQTEAMVHKPKMLTLDEFFAQAQAGQAKELRIILKADVQGSIEPIANSIEKLGDAKLQVKLLHTGTGNIRESDIMLAVASQAIVIGFSVQVDPPASRMAESEGVDVRVYDIIYRLVEDIDLALKGMLEPTFKEVVIGHVEVRAVFTVPGKKQVAGGLVTDGIAARNASVRVQRGGQVLFEGAVGSLRRFKDDVREVSAGMECGVGVEGFNNIAVGDILEFHRKEQEKA